MSWEWVQGYSRHTDGSPTGEVRNIRDGLRCIVRLYGDSPANAFDGMALEAVRNRMIEDGLCRNRINKDVSRMKRVFKWAVPKKLLPLSVFQELETVEGLRRGRSNARETAPVEPVSIAIVKATLPKLRPQVAAMVQLQLLTGMRPGEVTIMRPIDLNMREKIWRYTPSTHACAVARACINAKVPHWHPHQLRHTKATEVRKVAGPDAARAILGQRSLVATQIYAELDQDKARKLWRRSGSFFQESLSKSF